MKKTVSLLLAFLLICSVGGALATEYNEPGAFPICKEKVTLTVAIADNAKVEDYETNWQTQIMEEQANVDLVFQVYPNTEYNTKINVMVQSGEPLPDIIIGSFNNALVYSWAREGGIIPLTKYYDDPSISYYLHQAVERTGTNFFTQITMPDGEIYCIPALNQSYGNEYGAKYFIYQPWMEKLNLSYPATADELYDVLYAIVTSDPNGNGIQDEIGLTGFNGIGGAWFQYLMDSFVYCAPNVNYLVANDGTLSYAYTSDAWKEGLKYMRKMVENGIITTDTIVQEESQFNSLVNTDDVTVASFAWTSTSKMNTPDGRTYFYDVLPPMVGPEGVQYASFVPSACTPSFVISADCADPETAFRLGDLMVSEYLSIVTRFGQEGVDWDYPENARVNVEDYNVSVAGFDPYIFMYDTNFWSLAQQNRGWLQQGPFIRQYAIANGMVSETSPKVKDPNAPVFLYKLAADGRGKDYLYQEGGWAPKEVFSPLLYTDEESTVISDIQATLDAYINETTAAFLVGNKDIDEYWDTYLQELKTIGIDKALEINQTAYDRVYK